MTPRRKLISMLPVFGGCDVDPWLQEPRSPSSLVSNALLLMYVHDTYKPSWPSYNPLPGLRGKRVCGTLNRFCHKHS